MLANLLPMYLLGQKTMNIPVVKLSQVDNKSLANVRAIEKDKYGFTWIGTQDGLFRYDGITATEYNKNTRNLQHRILNNDVSALLYTYYDNSLWVLNSFTGISKINTVTGAVTKKIQITLHGNQNQNVTITRLLEHNESLYVSAEEGYVFKINKLNGTIGVLKNIGIQSKRKIEQICLLDNNFLVCYGGGTIQLFDSTFNHVLASADINETVQDFHFNNFCYNDKKELVLATTFGVRKIKSAKNRNSYLLTSQNVAEIDLKTDVQSIAFHDSSYWVSDNNTIYRFIPGQQHTIYKTSKGPDEQKWLNAVKVMSFSSGELWLGNQYGITIIKINPPPFTPYYQGDNKITKLNHCNNLLSVGDSMIYSCATDGFYSINVNDGAINPIGDNTYSLSVFKGPLDEVVFSNDKGTYVLKDFTRPVLISQYYKELASIDYDLIVSAEKYRDSLFFMASQYERGLHIYDIKKKKLKNINVGTFPEKLKTNVINNLILKDNQLWIVCDNAISNLDILTNRIYNHTIYDPETKLPLNIIMDMCFVKDKIWLAVYGLGLVELSPEFKIINTYSLASGIRNTGVYKIYNIGDSLLLTTSNNGLYSLNLQTKRIKSFFEEDGLHGNAFEESSGSWIGGKIVLGGVNGFTLVDPGKLMTNKVPPRIYVNNITVETPGKETEIANLDMGKIIVPNSVIQTIVHLSAINSTSSHNITFAWKLAENSSEWAMIGTQNFIPLIGLSPGTYHLQVKAANEDGVWSEPKELILVFLPKWYQTWWFYLLITLAVAAVLYALYRYRIAQIKKQHEIRKNIATDLHDDLGSTLNSVKVFTNLAISGIKQEESLQQIKDNLKEATSGLRDMIWVLDDSLDTVDELVTRIRQFAIPVSAASGIETIVNCETDINNRKLTKDEKRNLFLVCKEAINNSIKYSKAAQIHVSIVAYGKKVEIIITDNGTGFDMDTVKKGYGLKNMQYRAGQVKYDVEIMTEKGRGTEIRIKPE